MWLVKLLCLALYGMALAGALGWWRGDSAVIVQTVALLVLAAHAIEAALAFKLVRRYPGPLPLSICLTLLFGLVHLREVARQANRRSQARS